MNDLGYYNGAYGPIDEMTIPMNDRACWFGDGVYDAGASRDGVLFAMDEHIDRFYNSAKWAEINIPCSKDELKKLLQELMAKVDHRDQFVYFQCTRGTADRSHDYPEGMQGNLWVTIRKIAIPDGGQRVQLRTEEDTRFFHCNVKTINLLPAVLSSHKAESQGLYETVYWRLMDGKKRVTECAHNNVSIIKDGELWTAPCDNLILPGIARAHLIKACLKLGITVREQEYALEDLMDADEIIVTNCGNLAVYADAVDGISVGGRRPDLAQAIRAELDREFEEETSGSKN